MNIRALPMPLMALVLVVTMSGCAFPRKDFSSLPGPEIIKVRQDESGFHAVAPDCKPLLQPSQLNKATDLRHAIAFGCATYTNLAKQLAKPQDLTHPGQYAGQSPDSAGAAVQRYRDNAITPLRGTRATDAGVKN